MESSEILTLAWGAAKLPLSLAYLSLQLLKKEETLGTALQRLGWSSLERRKGPVLWLHVNGLGETPTVLPIVHRCLQEYNEKVTILLTTQCIHVYKLLGESLPQRVLVQLVPLANPLTIAAFLRKWQPQVGVFLDSPFQRELAAMAKASGVSLALLNAHMPGDDVLEWHARQTSRRMLRQTLSTYSLIVPRTHVDVGRFRMFGATLGQMPGWSTDLQQATELGACASRLASHRYKICRALLKRMAKRQLWIAANTLPGEEVIVARTHATLRSRHPGLLTLVAPQGLTAPGNTSGSGASGPLDPTTSSAASLCGAAVQRMVSEMRLRVELLSAVMKSPQLLMADVDILVLDEAEALTSLYALSEIVLVGGSLVPSFDGASSPASAAVAGCALLMGPHGAQYLSLASDINQAALVASEEAAAAVAQTGAMRADGGGGYDGGQRQEGEESGGAVTPTWEQLVVEARRPRLNERPMTAPPTVPETFHLRPAAPYSAISPFGGSVSYAGTPQTDSEVGPWTEGSSILRSGSGVPLTASGATTFGPGSGGQGPQAFFSRPGTAASLGAAGGGGGGASRSGRSAIDRFRWAAADNESAVGFGYSWSSDDDEEKEGEDGMSCCVAGAGGGGVDHAVFPDVEEEEDVRTEAKPTTGDRAGHAQSTSTLNYDPRQEDDSGVVSTSRRTSGSVPAATITRTSSTAFASGATPTIDLLLVHAEQEATMAAAGTAAKAASLDPDAGMISEVESASGEGSPWRDLPSLRRFLADGSPVRAVEAAANPDAAPASECGSAEFEDALEEGAEEELEDTQSDRQLRCTEEEEEEEVAPVGAGTVGGQSEGVIVASPSDNQAASSEASIQAADGVPIGRTDAMLSMAATVPTSVAPPSGLVLQLSGISFPDQPPLPTPLPLSAPAPLPESLVSEVVAARLGSSRCTHVAHLILAGGDDAVAWLERAPDAPASELLPAPPSPPPPPAQQQQQKHQQPVSSSPPPPPPSALRRQLRSDPGFLAPPVRVRRAGVVAHQSVTDEAHAFFSSSDGPSNGASPSTEAPLSPAYAAACEEASDAAVGAYNGEESIRGAYAGGVDVVATSSLAARDQQRYRVVGDSSATDTILLESWTTEVSLAATPVAQTDSSTTNSVDISHLLGHSPPGSATAAAATRDFWLTDSPQLSRGSFDHYLQTMRLQGMLSGPSGSFSSTARLGLGFGGGGYRLPQSVASRSLRSQQAHSLGSDSQHLTAAAMVEGKGAEGVSDGSGPDSPATLAAESLDMPLMPLPPSMPVEKAALPAAAAVTGPAAAAAASRLSSVSAAAAAVASSGTSWPRGRRCSDASSTTEQVLSVTGYVSAAANNSSSQPTIAAAVAVAVANTAATNSSAADGKTCPVDEKLFVLQPPVTADSPTSDFEFPDGSVPDDSASGSPTLLATASVQNSSGATLNLLHDVASQDQLSQSGAGGVGGATAANSNCIRITGGTGGGAALADRPEPINPLAIICVPGQVAHSVTRTGSRMSSPASSSRWPSLAGSLPGPSAAGSPARPGTASGVAGVARPVGLHASPTGSTASAVSGTADATTTSGGGGGGIGSSSFADQSAYRWWYNGSPGQGTARPQGAAAGGSSSTNTSDGGLATDGGAASGTGPSGAAAAAAVWDGLHPGTLASVASRASVERPGMYQVASIANWLADFGSLLAQPSLEVQRSQAEQDPTVWYAMQAAAGRAGGEMGGPGGSVGVNHGSVIQGVAPGFRAPMHSPLRPFEEDRGLQINPRALASVKTMLFPAAPTPYNPPVAATTGSAARPGVVTLGAAVLPSQAGSASSSTGGSATGVAPAAPGRASPLRHVTSPVRPDPVTAAFTLGRAQAPSQLQQPPVSPRAMLGGTWSTAGSSSTVDSSASNQWLYSAEPVDLSGSSSLQAAARVSGGGAGAGDATTQRQDALSRLLNSPKSPVSPVRTSRMASPVALDRRALAVALATAGGPSTAAAPAFSQGPAGPAASPQRGHYSQPTGSPAPAGSDARASSGSGFVAAGPTSPSAPCPLPMALPTINTPRRELQRHLSAPLQRASPPSSSPLRNVPSPMSPRPSQGGKLRGSSLKSLPGPFPSTASVGTTGNGGAGAESACSSASSSCPNTPTSRAATTASSPFRGGPVDMLLRSQMSAASNCSAATGQSFEESFEAAVRAGPTRSPIRPAPATVSAGGAAGGGGSVYGSPYKSPVVSPFAAMLAAGGGTVFGRSLFAEEEEEEQMAAAAAQAWREGGAVARMSVEEQDDDMPLSPRANSCNVLFSPDPVIRAGSAAASRRQSPLPAPPPPPVLPPPPPLLSSVMSAAAAVPGRPYKERVVRLSQALTTAVAAATGAAAAGSPFLTHQFDIKLDEPSISRPVGNVSGSGASGSTVDTARAGSDGVGAGEGGASGSTMPGMPSLGESVPEASSEASTAVADGPTGLSEADPFEPRVHRIQLDNAPTFSRIPSLSETDDDESSSRDCSPARASSLCLHPDSAGRLPRITLSGGPLVVSAVAGGGSGCALHPKSHLSQMTCLADEVTEEGEGEEEEDAEDSAGTSSDVSASLASKRSVATAGSGDDAETPRQIPKPQAVTTGGSESGCSSTGNVTGSGSNGNSGINRVSSSGPSYVNGCDATAIKLASAAATAVRNGSPPRSPEQRTSCPRSAQPTASPIKAPLLLSAQSSPGPKDHRGFAAADGQAPYGPLLPCMLDLSPRRESRRSPLPPPPPSPPLLSPRASNQPSSPFSSPPASYMSPCATDPRASPIKVQTAIKRTPSEMPSASAAASASVVLSPSRSFSDSTAYYGAFTTNSAASLGAIIFGQSYTTTTATAPASTTSTTASVPPPSPKRFGVAADAGDLGFACVPPVRTQPAVPRSSPCASPRPTALPPGSPLHRGPQRSPQQSWNGTSIMQPGSNPMAGGMWGDEGLLATRASAPAGMQALADGGLPPTPRSARRDAHAAGPFAGSGGGSGAVAAAPVALITDAAARLQAQDLGLHAQRTQQQMLWDRARAESRTASAAGTPRSARALFSSDTAPAAAINTSGFLRDVASSPAPRSPRLSAGPSPAAHVFALDAAGIDVATQGTTVPPGDEEEESWQVQQARHMHNAVGDGQCTPRSARVLFPAAPASAGPSATYTPSSPTGASAAAGVGSPSWSRVSRQLFSDPPPAGVNSAWGSVRGSAASIGGSSAAGGAVTSAVAAGATTTTALAGDRDPLAAMLSRMTVHVASPVSPQPRPLSPLPPPPPVSPRPMASPGRAAHAAVATGASAGAAAVPSSPRAGGVLHSADGRSGASGNMVMRPVNGCALAGGGSSMAVAGGGAGPQGAPAGGAAQSTQSDAFAAPPPRRALTPQGYGSAGFTARLPLPQLPPLPPLSALPQLNLPGVGEAGGLETRASAPVGGGALRGLSAMAPVGWPPFMPPTTDAPFMAAAETLPSLLPESLGAEATAGADAVRRRLLFPGEGCGGLPVPTCVPLPTMPGVVEQQALSSLESQFEVAMHEAADLPIETRVPTPNAVIAATASSGGFGGAGVAFGGDALMPLPFFSGIAGAPAAATGRPRTAPDSYSVPLRQAAAPPSPRAPRPSAVRQRSVDAAVAGNLGGAGGVTGAATGPYGVNLGAGGFSGGDSLRHGGAGFYEANKPRMGSNSAGSGAVGGGGGSAAVGPSAAATAAPAKAAVAVAGITAPAGFHGVRQAALPTAAAPAAPRMAPAEATPGGYGRRSSAAVQGGCYPATTAAAAGTAAGGHGCGTPPCAGVRPQSSHSSRMPDGGASGGSSRCSPWGSAGGAPPVSRGETEQLQHLPLGARYAGQFLIPPSQLASDPGVGPAVWVVSNEAELAAALSALLRDPVERRSRGRAAQQGAAKLASSLVSTVWNVLEDVVIAPALQNYISSSSAADAAAT